MEVPWCVWRLSHVSTAHSAIVQEGRGLATKDGSQPNSYCIVYILTPDGKRRKLNKTPVKKGTCSPMWATVIEGYERVQRALFTPLQ